MDGFGVYKYSDGERYEGEWKDDNWHGRGKLTSADGRVREGNWLDHKRDGEHIFQTAIGLKFKEMWSTGDLVSSEELK